MINVEGIKYLNKNEEQPKQSIYPELEELLSAVVLRAFEDLVDGYEIIFTYSDHEPDMFDTFMLFKAHAEHEKYRNWEDAKRFCESKDLIIFTKIPGGLIIKRAQEKAKENLNEILQAQKA